MTDKEAFAKYQPTRHETLLKHDERTAADGSPLYAKQPSTRTAHFLKSGFKVVEAPAPAPPEAVKVGQSAPKEIDVTPAAAKLAKEHGIDLKDVTGTGADGGITKPDVQAIVDQKEAE